MTERLQKILATAGVASRRAIEDLIREGRVTVNGRPAEIGQKVDHDDHVRVDGRSIVLSRKAQPARVLLYRKRVGELVTRDDPEGRRTVFRKLPELETGRWIAVGRLDINTSGLLLLTNDGELARRLTHPSFEMVREYAVRVLGEIGDDVVERLKKGVELDDGPAHFDSIRTGEHEEEGEDSANTWWIVTVSEGRNRVVRRLFESQNLQVSRLIRIGYGPIQLGRGIRTGSYREATPEELAGLLLAVGMNAQAAPKKKSRAADSEGETVKDRAKPGRPQPRARPSASERAPRPSQERPAKHVGPADKKPSSRSAGEEHRPKRSPRPEAMQQTERTRTARPAASHARKRPYETADTPRAAASGETTKDRAKPGRSQPRARPSTPERAPRPSQERPAKHMGAVDRKPSSRSAGAEHRPKRSPRPETAQQTERTRTARPAAPHARKRPYEAADTPRAAAPRKSSSVKPRAAAATRSGEGAKPQRSGQKARPAATGRSDRPRVSETSRRAPPPAGAKPRRSGGPKKPGR